MDNEIRIKLGNRITTDNCKDTEENLNSIISENEGKDIILDCDALEYVSSSGLRVFLKIKKQYGSLKLVNVSNEVYEILDVTGFSSMLEVEKKRRRLSIKDATIIGDGCFSEVFRIDRETIVKVYIKDTEIDEIQRELDLAKQGFVLGLPTAISYDIVEIADKPVIKDTDEESGKIYLGVVFELLDCRLFRDELRDNMDKYEESVEKYAELLKTINTTDVGKTNLPKAKEVELDKLERNKKYMTEAEYEKMKALLEELPDTNTFIHGDCHVKNIMVNKGEFILIDMDTLVSGYPIFELSKILAAYIAFPYKEPGNALSFFGIPDEIAAKLFYDTVRIYFGNISDDDFEDNIKKIKLVAANHMMYWVERYGGKNPVNAHIDYEIFKKYINEVDSLLLKLG